MEEHWFFAPMSRLAISPASLNFFFPEIFHDNLEATYKSTNEKNYFV